MNRISEDVSPSVFRHLMSDVQQGVGVFLKLINLQLIIIQAITYFSQPENRNKDGSPNTEEIFQVANNSSWFSLLFIICSKGWEM